MGEGLAAAMELESSGQIVAKEATDVLAVVLQLIEQMEARIRELEGAVFDSVMEEGTKPRAVAAVTTAKTYSTAVAKSPKEHGLGPPHIHQFAAYLGAVVQTKHQGLDPAVSAKLFCLQCLQACLVCQDLSQALAWVKSFRVSSLNEKGKHAGKVRVVYRLKGMVCLPTKDQLQPMLAKMAEAGEDKEARKDVAEQLVVVTDTDVPAAANMAGAGAHMAGGRAVEVQALLTSFLAQQGAVRFDSKPPRGGLAWELHQHLSKR